MPVPSGQAMRSPRPSKSIPLPSPALSNAPNYGFGAVSSIGSYPRSTSSSPSSFSSTAVDVLAPGDLVGEGLPLENELIRKVPIAPAFITHPAHEVLAPIFEVVRVLGGRRAGVQHPVPRADGAQGRGEQRGLAGAGLADHPDPGAVAQRVADLVERGSLPREAAAFLDAAVVAGLNIVVAGGTQSGKTTFLNIAGLLETFSGGEYVLDGVNVKGLDDNARSRLRNEKLGFIFQGFNLIPDLNLFDNVDVPLRYRGFSGAQRKERI